MAHQMTTASLGGLLYELHCQCGFVRRIQSSSPGTYILIHAYEQGLPTGGLLRDATAYCGLCEQWYAKVDAVPCPEHAGAHRICALCASELEAELADDQ